MLNKSIAVATSKYESEVVQVLTAWATSFPAEVQAFDGLMKYERDGLENEKGIGENMRRWGEIPVTLHRLMCGRFGGDWHDNTAVRNFFWQHFQMGRMRRDGYNDRLKKAGRDV